MTIVAYLCGRKDSCLYQQHHSSSRQVGPVILQGSVISPALYNHYVSDCLITDADMTSYAGDFTLLAKIVEAEAMVNLLCTILARWADGKQLIFAPQKYSMTPFKSDTRQS